MEGQSQAKKRIIKCQNPKKTKEKAQCYLSLFYPLKYQHYFILGWIIILDNHAFSLKITRI